MARTSPQTARRVLCLLSLMLVIGAACASEEVRWQFTALDGQPGRALTDRFQRVGLEHRTIGPDGWHLWLKEADTILTSPPVQIQADAQKSIVIRWKTQNLEIDPVLEWTTSDAPTFDASRAMSFKGAAESGSGQITIPVHRSLVWRGTITQLRIRFANRGPADVWIQYWGTDAPDVHR